MVSFLYAIFYSRLRCRSLGGGILIVLDSFLKRQPFSRLAPPTSTTSRQFSRSASSDLARSTHIFITRILQIRMVASG
ncbi:hypothetical protein ZEAMMB73_Zm00001d046807 [Zea mays]|uniref:Uncharacterized protein n=1 Tax=Zea mays TaxID=4577 RepID=A0A1D6P510_MAIZE|nr:hypothetical protein ZEAMMB73_Zm00001d046807 [Zea mays]